MNEFKTYHPIVNLVYFALVIGFSCFFMHPVCLGISLVCAFAYSAMQKGGSLAKRSLIYILPMLGIMALLNPVFNHKGATILGYLPSGNPLTMESIIYGFAAAVMLISIICWFSCFSEVMTSDKIVYLFGRVLPSVSLVFSMTLRFVPKFTAQLKAIVNVQKCLGRDMTGGSIVKRAKCGLSALSAATTWALENAVDTADSMKSRGYGLSGRTAFSIFRFDSRDKALFIAVMLLGIYVLFGSLNGVVHFSYFPYLSGAEPSLYGLSVFAAYTALCLCPVIIELWEVRRWKITESKM